MSTEPPSGRPADDPTEYPSATLGPARPAAPKNPAMAPAGATTTATIAAGDGAHEHHWFAPPTKPVGPLFVTLLVLAQFVFFVALLGPAVIAIAVKVAQIVPDAEKTSALGIVSSIGAIAAFVGNVVFGRFSDRTTSRWGRRRPWLIGGCIVMIGAFVIMAGATSVAVLSAGWFLAQLGANATLAPFIATIADQVPVEQRAKVSSLIGIAQNVGILIAVYLAQALTDNMTLLFVGPAVFALVAMAIYAWKLPDQHLTVAPPKMTPREWVQTFWVSPVRHPDYALAWWSRFFIILSSFMFSTYRLFFLTDRIDLTPQEAAATVATGVLIFTIVLIPAGYLGGYISDKTGRRKMLVCLSAALFGIGLVVLALSHTVPTFYVVEAIMGVAYGIYMGVDLALVVDVLPNPDDSGKDLGVFNMANAIPQTVAPGIAAFVLAINSVDNKNYTLLFWVAGIAALLGALVVLPIKKVR